MISANCNDISILSKFFHAGLTDRTGLPFRHAVPGARPATSLQIAGVIIPLSVEQVGRKSPDTMLFERASSSLLSLLPSTHAGRHRSSFMASTDDLPIS